MPLPRLRRSERSGAAAAAALLASAALPRIAANDPSCWGGGVTWEHCCAAHFGPAGNAACWEGPYTYDRCCGPVNKDPVPALEADPGQSYPECVKTGIVLRHAGSHGLFTDVKVFGHAGCFMNNCAYTDKFVAGDKGVCARLCAETPECTHWAFGRQDEKLKCFLRTSDEGREWAPGWAAGARACAPPALPDAFVALTVADSPGLVACDGGKSENCPDVAAATTTWRFAIRHLLRAVTGLVDAETQGHIDRISVDSANFLAGLTAEYRPSDLDFPRIVFNNRLIFNNLKSWLSQFGKAPLSETDGSLPWPLRTGRLCGESCYGP